MDKSIFMLAESVKWEAGKTYNTQSYIAQIKKDGERCIAVIENGEVILFNRRGRIINENFKEIEADLKDFDNCILDGEICSIDDKFETLQSRVTKNKFKREELMRKSPCIFWVFDILKIEGINLMKSPLSERIRELYCFLDISKEHIKLLPYYSVLEAMKIADEIDGEGIMIKSLNGYYENKRSYNWLKCKRFKETTIILQSYTPNNAGIRCETAEGVAVQIAGEQSIEVKQILDKGEKAEVFIQYLGDKTENGKYRFISYRGLKK